MDDAHARPAASGAPEPALAPLGLGLAALGRPAYLTAGRDRDLGADRSVTAMRARAHAMLDAAWDRGIRFVDAARSYGRAEEFLGSWLTARPGRRPALAIESKWGYEYVGDWRMDAAVHERKEHSLAMLDHQWPETLAALGGAPDRYLVHSLTPESAVLADGVLLDRLRELAASGVSIGVSTSGPHQGDALDAARELPDSPFATVQATWNLQEPSAGEALGRAHEAGWFVVLKEVLANGRLADGAGTAGEPHAAALAEADGQPLPALAVGAARSQPWADVVLSGAVTPAQLDAGLDARTPSVAAGALAELARDPGDYWSDRGAREWS
ncbi:aldo/keto reductase [Agromyces sp. SYSU T0242]|uniref:aldo/keto reductase n=1 Tax=Agromyces litoreus TaxID=3158561 RepID=UPI00339138CA